MPLVLFMIVFLNACATTQNVSVSESANNLTVESAFLVLHKGMSADMDEHFRRSLQTRGIDVIAGKDNAKFDSADIIVEYEDRWNWDMVMYLETLNLTVVSGKTGDLIASGNWHNSYMHQFVKADDIVNQVLDEVFAQIKVGKN